MGRILGGGILGGGILGGDEPEHSSMEHFSGIILHDVHAGNRKTHARREETR